MLRRPLLSLLVLATCVVARPAFAQPEAERVAACEAASIRAQRSKIAHALVQSRKDLLVCSASDCPTLIRRDCDRWLTELDAILPTIVPGAQDARGRDLADVRVDVDGTNVAARIEGAAVPIDPGAHTLRFSRGTGSEARVVEQQIVVREGERGRPVSVRFPPGPGEEPKPPPPPPEPSPWLSIGTYVFAGLSITALGVGTIETIRGVSQYKDLRDSCGATRSCEPSAVEGARHALSEEIADTRDTFTTALLGVRGELSDAVAEVRDANAAANQATRNELAADITLTRTELSGEIGEIRERQLGALARLKLVDAAVTNTIGDVTELRDQIERAVNHSAAEAREGLTAVLTAWNTRFDTLATQGAHTEEDLVHARETLQREITRVEACTFAALEKLAADIATGDAQLQQTIGAELAEVRDQASGALARLTLIDQALRGTPELEQRIQKLEIAAGNTETEQALADFADLARKLRAS